jgi:hypothetical protein
MSKKSIAIIISTTVVVLLALLGKLLQSRNQQAELAQAELAYDTSGKNIVIYANMQPRPGGPLSNQPCPGYLFPRLRVWGDCLVFLDVSVAGLAQHGQWSGTLTPAQIHAALESLQAQGFFERFTPEGPNPAGTMLLIGANLQAQTVEYSSGDLNPKIYAQLIDQLKPDLQPISQPESTDPRIQAVLAEIKSCSP